MRTRSPTPPATELADIRRHMRAAQAKSRQILQKIISSPSYGKILQETIITQRDGRFVVPVKAEHKGDLPGLVHDVSSTGATLFVEPMGVVQANNELHGAAGQGAKGDRPHPGGALRRGCRPPGGHPVGLRHRWSTWT